MKISLLTTIICLFTLFSFAQQTQKDGFVSLFNGKNLKGWTPTTEKPESFFVKDGVLMVKDGKAHLFYSGKVGNADFKNFELKLKVRTTKGSNSGVYFHTQYQKEGWPKVGFEAQVNSTHTDPRKTGSLYGIANMYVVPDDEEAYTVKVDTKPEVFISCPKAPSTDGEWFDYHIIVQDNTIVIKVNGHTTVKWTQAEDWTKKRRIGHGTVAIQAHDPNSETHYKDIRIKVLD